MECKCPNCKGDAKTVMVGGVEYIKCKACGWFVKQDDGTWTACEEPTAGSHNSSSGGEAGAVAPAPPVKEPPSSVEAGKDGGSLPPSEPAEDEDEGGLVIELVDEIDY